MFGIIGSDKMYSIEISKTCTRGVAFRHETCAGMRSEYSRSIRINSYNCRLAVCEMIC